MKYHIYNNEFFTTRIYFILLLFKLLSHSWLFGNPMDCSPPDSSVHGISQARILSGLSFPTPGGSSQPRDWIHVSWIGSWDLYQGTTREALQICFSMLCSYIVSSFQFYVLSVKVENFMLFFPLLVWMLVNRKAIHACIPAVWCRHCYPKSIGLWISQTWPQITMTWVYGTIFLIYEMILCKGC